MKRAIWALSILLSGSFSSVAAGSAAFKQAAHEIPHHAVHFFGDLCSDVVSLHLNLFSSNSLKIVTGIVPLYLWARNADETIQGNFYNSCNHTNDSQLPATCHQVAQKAVGIPMVALSSLALFARDQDLRLTGRLFALGLPFVHSGKDVIKKWRSTCCLRPWHENFSREERSSGGFPSGHTANVVFMTALFGMRHGPRWGIPLGLFATFVIADFINCNRHYLSQMVAGAGLRLLYAFAANTVIEKRLSDRWEFGLEPTACGLPVARLVYKF